MHRLWIASLLPAALALASGPLAASARPDPPNERWRAVLTGHNGAVVESLATALLRDEEARPAADSLWIAELAFRLAHARNERLGSDDLARSRIAQSLGIRIRHLPPNDEAIGEAELVYAEQAFDSDPARALAHAELALSILASQPTPLDSLVTTAKVDIGVMRVLAGRGREAIPILRAAVEDWRRYAGGPYRRMLNPLSWIGKAYLQVGDSDSARFSHEEALRVLDAIATPSDRARSTPMVNLMELATLSGDLSRAIDLGYASLRDLEAGGDPRDVLAGRSNLATILMQFEDDEGALRELEAGMSAVKGIATPEELVVRTARLNLAACYLALGRYDEALIHFEQVEAEARAHPDPLDPGVRAIAVLGQAQVHQAKKHHAEALAACRRGIALNDSSAVPDRISQVSSRALQIRIAEAMGDTNQIATARRELEAIRSRFGLAGTSTGAMLAHWMARADRDLGRADLAWSGALEADRMDREVLRLDLAMLPDSRALQLVRRRSYILDQVLDQADEQRPERWETSWDRLVRRRGLVRAELQHRRLPTGLQSDSALVAAHRRWTSAQREFARRLVRGAASAEDSASRSALAGLALAADEASASYTRALRSRGTDTTRTDVGLGDVRAALSPGQALVAFAEVEARDGTRRVLAYVTRGGESAITRLSFGTSAELRAVLEPWRERLANSPGAAARTGGRAERECRRLGARVRTMLWDPIAAAIGNAQDLVIVPDDPLADVAWLALPVGDDRYLVEEDRSIRIADSERDLLPDSSPTISRVLLALGDPSYGEAPTDRGSAFVLRAAVDTCAIRAWPRFRPLPNTATEVRDAAQSWESERGAEARVLVGDDATESAFREFAPRARVIHVATHGYVLGNACRGASGGERGFGGIAIVGGPPAVRSRPRASSPEPPPPASPWMGRRVWLALAAADHAPDAAHDEDDGLLTAEEVVTLDLSQADWVVLSACQSGYAENWSREGTLGMQRAFRLAGARSVIASQWPVEDASTVQWMRSLYGARSRGEVRASAALASACRSVLAERRRTGRSTHPFYWAAFRAYGP